MTDNPQGTIDRLDFESLINADRSEGPKVSIYLPTKVAGGQDKISAGLLRDEITKAKADVLEAGVSEETADAILAPAQALVSDSSYWLHLSRGLAIFAAEGFFTAVRIPLEVSALRTVDAHFNVVPLTPMLEQDGRVYVLALSRNVVRLFDATRNHIEELPLGETHSDEGAAAEHPEAAQHSGGNDAEDHMQDAFLRNVGEAVAQELGTARSQPLVLASVAEYLTPFKHACPYPNIQDVVIPGNPEHTRPEELRSRAWELLNEKLQEEEATTIETARSLIANGKGSYDLGEIVQAAGEGRVDTLFTPRDLERLTNNEAYSLTSQAIMDTVANKGRVHTLAEFPESSEAVATFRY